MFRGRNPAEENLLPRAHHGEKVKSGGGDSPDATT